MIIADAYVQFDQSPLGVALISFACFALITIAGAAIRMVVQMAKLQSSIEVIVKDITEIKTDPDVMRWSNYGRMTRATQGQPTQPGEMP